MSEFLLYLVETEWDEGADWENLAANLKAVCVCMCVYIYTADGNFINFSLAQLSFTGYSQNKTICFVFIVKQVGNLMLPANYIMQEYLADWSFTFFSCESCPLDM